MANHTIFAPSEGDPSDGRRNPGAVNGQAAGSTPADGMTRLRALGGMLWKGKWVLLAVFVAVVGAAAAYTYSLSPRYRTSTLLLVDQQDGGGRGVLSSNRSSTSSIFGRQGPNLSNEVLVLNQSGTIAHRVARRLDTMQTYPQSSRRLGLLYNSDGSRRSINHLAAIVGGRVNARIAGREVDAIRISASSTVPAQAALLANLYAEEYIAWTREKSRKSLQATRDFLVEQTSRFKKKVEATEGRIEEYMRREGAVSLDQEMSRVVKRLSDLEARRDELEIELDMERSSLQTQQNELEELRPKLAERLSSGLDEELTRIQEDRAELEYKINQIRQQNPTLTAGGGSPKARDLARLQRRSDRLARQADSLAQAYVEETLAAGGVGTGSDEGERGLAYVVEQQKKIAQQRIKVSGLEAQLKTVKNRIEEYRQRMRELPKQSFELAQLQRERRSSEQIYGYVREKLQETRMALESEVGYAEIIQPAGTPGIPISPNTRRNLTLAAILGLLLGGGVVYLRERMDTRLRTPGDLQDRGYRVIGVIPSMTSLIESQFGGEDKIDVDGIQVDTSLVMLASPMSAAAESYRRLRANLRFARPDTTLHSLVVTSSEKGEGKTTTAANLALAMASAGKRTVLVDADLRRPRIHKFLNVDRSPGLSEMLYAENIDPASLSTGIDNFFVLPAGEEVPNPAELLGSDRMRSLVGRLEDAFDAVIIDTPPLLLFSDPITVAPHVDGALLVAAAGETDGRAFGHGVDLLKDVNAALVGAVLNRYDVADRRGYDYRYSYGSYGYRYADRQLEEYYKGEAANGSASSPLKFWT